MVLFRSIPELSQSIDPSASVYAQPVTTPPSNPIAEAGTLNLIHWLRAMGSPPCPDQIPLQITTQALIERVFIATIQLLLQFITRV